jgi:RNA recognition motif-containing protein
MVHIFIEVVSIGPVVRAETLMSNGRPKGAGLVRFEDASACERAIGRFDNLILLFVRAHNP